MKEAIVLKNFQKEAVEKGVSTLIRNKRYVLQSPTGTGKTLIASALVDSFLETIEDVEGFENGITILHFTPSTGSLDSQNYNKFTEYKKTANFNKYNTWRLNSDEEMNISSFEESKVHFFGWSSLISTYSNKFINDHPELGIKEGDPKNRIVRTSEAGGWDYVLKETLNKDRKILIIIDEQHLNKKNAGATKLFLEERLFKPYFDKYNENPYIFEASATVNVSGVDEIDHIVPYSAAVGEMIVKKNIIVCNTMDPEILLREAVEKRREIETAYRSKKILKSDNTPLMVIQIKNGEENSLEEIINILKQQSNSNEPIKDEHIAIWFDKRKETNDGTKINKSDIENNGSIKFLIFKQAIATGWDIPRASLWVKLRNKSEKSFEVQTLGRVLRNQFRKYFDNDLIDMAYVFSNDPDVIKKVPEINGSSKSFEKIWLDIDENIDEYKKDKINIIQHHNEFNNVLSDELIEEIVARTFNEHSKLINIIRENVKDDSSLDNWTIFMKEFDFKMDEIDINDISFENNLRQLENFNGSVLPLHRRYSLFKLRYDNEILLKVLEAIFEKITFEINENGFEYSFIKRAWQYFFEQRDGVQELDDAIKEEINKAINENVEVDNSDKFIFKERIETIKSHVNHMNFQLSRFDKYNLYKTSYNIGLEDETMKKIDIFDSDIERLFYLDVMLDNVLSKKEVKYFVYNEVNSEYFFKISYIDNTGAISNYYPDWIVSTNDKVYILDTKGYDSKNKKFTRHYDSIKKLEEVNKYIDNGLLSVDDKEIIFGYVWYKIDSISGKRVWKFKNQVSDLVSNLDEQ